MAALLTYLLTHGTARVRACDLLSLTVEERLRRVRTEPRAHVAAQARPPGPQPREHSADRRAAEECGGRGHADIWIAFKPNGVKVRILSD